MLTRWSTRLSFDAICVSSVEILAELNVDKVSAALTCRGPQDLGIVFHDFSLHI